MELGNKHNNVRITKEKKTIQSELKALEQPNIKTHHAQREEQSNREKINKMGLGRVDVCYYSSSSFSDFFLITLTVTEEISATMQRDSWTAHKPSREI